ncbi:glycoside hydrolase family 15 protein [Streptomyces tritici]|uniref:glycoside hydrolase family 15 protein n=1 Tax=Streptomyces tritici TaxID=2054410 RepID=UPI003AF119B5
MRPAAAARRLGEGRAPVAPVAHRATDRSAVSAASGPAPEPPGRGPVEPGVALPSARLAPPTTEAGRPDRAARPEPVRGAGPSGGSGRPGPSGPPAGEGGTVNAYPPIADHGMVGDLQTAALVSAGGTIHWWCTPRFDSPSVFASLLDSERGGYCRLTVEPSAGEEPTVQQLASAPVRAGNAAADQLQLDIYGEAADALSVGDDMGAIRGWKAFSDGLDWLVDHWDQPDEGIWETRGGRQDFTHSRLMTWVALDRGLRLATTHSRPADLARWTGARDAVFRQLVERGWSEKRQAFVHHYATDVLDASLLLMPRVGFLSPRDPGWLTTLDAMGEELVSDSLVYRYDPAASPDGLRGSEGTFNLCSFLYVEALARSGRIEQARYAFDKMLTYANHVGLFAEEIGPSGEQLGNFPQAFTHLALIAAAMALDDVLDASETPADAGPRTAPTGG